jgi:ribose-phosphate pyrophosphokinase
VYVWASHGIFTADALEKIERCENIHQVVVTNTCPLPASYDGSKVSHSVE